jgi:hypothetical protein
MALLVTYSNDEPQRRSFDVLVHSRKLGELVIERRSPEQDVRFFDAEYLLPEDLLTAATVTVRFQATGAGPTGAVVGLRTLRADAPR